MIRIVYRDRRFYWARRYVKNDHEVDLPVPRGTDNDGPIAAARFYLQGRADALADLHAFATTLAGLRPLDVDELREWAELGRRARRAAAD